MSVVTVAIHVHIVQSSKYSLHVCFIIVSSLSIYHTLKLDENCNINEKKCKERSLYTECSQLQHCMVIARLALESDLYTAFVTCTFRLPYFRHLISLKARFTSAFFCFRIFQLMASTTGLNLKDAPQNHE